MIDPQIEREVLGAIIMRQGQNFSVARRLLSADDFGRNDHQDIFRAIEQLVECGDAVDVVTISACLRGHPGAVQVPALSLAALTDSVATTVHLERQARELHALAVRRRIVRRAELLAEAGKNPNFTTNQFLLRAREEGALTETITEEGKTRKLGDGLVSAMQGLIEYSAGNQRDRIPFGITKVDRALHGGMYGGGMYLLGAPTGAGKTSLALQVSVDCAIHHGPSLVVSPEMSLEELAEREIIRKSGIPKADRGFWVRRDDERRIGAERAHDAAFRELMDANLPIHILDSTEATMSDVVDAARSIDGLRLVVIDYAQEVASRRAQQQRYLHVGDVARDSIVLARRMKIPILVASQVNATKNDRGKTEYTYRESMVLEQKARCAMVLEIKWSEDADHEGRYRVEGARLFAKKNRGPLFNVPVDYRPDIFTIRDATERPWAPPETQPVKDWKERY
jgi:replicative DNA helicase